MFCSPITLCLVNCVTETIQPIEGRKYSPRRLHVGQHCHSLCEWISPRNTSVAHSLSYSIMCLLHTSGNSQYLRSVPHVVTATNVQL